jgi:hypothetical protein
MYQYPQQLGMRNVKQKTEEREKTEPLQQIVMTYYYAWNWHVQLEAITGQLTAYCNKIVKQKLVFGVVLR